MNINARPKSDWSFKILPVGNSLGADVEANLVEHLEDDLFIYELKRALAQHLVLRLRNQKFTAAQAVKFMGLWGIPMDVRRQLNPALHIEGYPAIQILSNIRNKQGQRIGDGNTSAQVWHTDNGMWEVPPWVVVFYGRIAPEPAPKTHFLNMIKVYEDLPDDLKKRIARLRVRHHMYSQAVDVTVYKDGASMSLEHRANGISQPMVRRHMATNRPILYLPTRRDSIIDGMPEGESVALLTDLWDRANTAPYTFSSAMMPDDIIIWDNAATVHGRDGWPETQERSMWHMSVAGERPTPMFPRETANLNYAA